MEVEDVDAVGAELAQALVEVSLEALGLVDTGLGGIHFCRECEAAFLPFCVSCPGFLLAADVHAGGVDFVVALGLEGVEAFCEVVEVGYAGAGGFIGT